MTCREVEDSLAAFADGLSTRAAEIEAHVAACANCRRSAHMQRAARTVLRGRAAGLSLPAPPGLRTRLIAVGNAQVPSPKPQGLLGWTGRLSAFAAAAVLVLTVGAVVLPIATIRSTTLLAAQLALDHLKCFRIDGDADGTPITKEQAESTLQREYDLSVTVPPSLDAERLQLMAARRCLYGDGRAAHLMYRLDGEPVSLFVMQGLARPAAQLSLFGHEQMVWTQGDRTYMLIAGAGSRNGLARVASYLQTEAK